MNIPLVQNPEIDPKTKKHKSGTSYLRKELRKEPQKNFGGILSNYILHPKDEHLVDNFLSKKGKKNEVSIKLVITSNILTSNNDSSVVMNSNPNIAIILVLLYH